MPPPSDETPPRARTRRRVSPNVARLLENAVEVLHGTPRPGQLQMAEAVATAFDSGEHLFVQAGTGTGKSLGYLVPAVRVGARVVVSTATLALQTQLVERDLPVLVEAVTPALGRAPSFAVLKGRGNYACKHRLAVGGPDEQDALIDISPTTELGREVVRVRRWVEETATGDRDELEPGVSDRVWTQVSVSARECLGADRCPFGAECFAEFARDRAAAADLVVTNHAMLAIDAMHNRTTLPPHDYVVVDEAHDLAARVTSVAAAELSVGMVERVARRVRAHVDDAVHELLTAAIDDLGRAFSAVTEGRLDALPPEVAAAVAGVRDAARTAVSKLGGERKCDVSAGDRGDEGPDGTDGSDNADAARRQARALATEVFDVADRLLGHDPADVIWAEARRGMPFLRVAPLSVAELLRESLFSDRTVVLTSATLAIGGSFDTVARSVGLVRDPDEPTASASAPSSQPDSDGRTNGDGDAKSDDSRAGDDPGKGKGKGKGEGEDGGEGQSNGSGVGDGHGKGNGHGKGEQQGNGSGVGDGHGKGNGHGKGEQRSNGSGVGDGHGKGNGHGKGEQPSKDDPLAWHGIDVGSPFSYERQAILYVARHLPPPGRAATGERTFAELLELMTAAGGRTLGLFSSRRAAEAAAAYVRERCDLDVLCQGEQTLADLGRRFRSEARTSLFGTLSLWQGIDVPGGSCQLVAIDRIPFPRPDDPLMSARTRAVEAAGGNGFMAVSVAHAALLLAQGSGRLIRRDTDRGVVAILDSRVATARYGSYLLRSLPPMWRTTEREVALAALRRLDATAMAVAT